MNANQVKTGRSFWLAWILASVIGYGIGALLGIRVAYGLFTRDVFDATMGVTFGVVLGATGGFVQWVILREKIARAGWWILASALGFAVAAGAIGVIGISERNQNYAVTGGLMVAVFGGAGGILQWLILRRQFARTSWWVLANILGSLVGVIGIPAADAVSVNGNYDQSTLVFGLLFGAGLGTITGAALVWILRQSPSRKVDGLATAH
jgi:hypothetical protein